MQKDLHMQKIVEERGRDIREIMHTEENYIEKNLKKVTQLKLHPILRKPT
jgi:hypothetical protein